MFNAFTLSLPSIATLFLLIFVILLVVSSLFFSSFI